MVWVKPSLLKRYSETKFFRISEVCRTSFSTSVLSDVNFSSTSPTPATLVVWWSLRRIFLSLILWYFLNRLRSWQTYETRILIMVHSPLTRWSIVIDLTIYSPFIWVVYCDRLDDPQFFLWAVVVWILWINL